MNTEILFPHYPTIYKGNLHSHSVRSDGAYSVTELVQAYKQKNYHFLAISDHHLYGKADQLASPELLGENFILLDGMEGGTRQNKFHIQAIGSPSLKQSKITQSTFAHDENTLPDEAKTPQDMLDLYGAKGNICIVNHPHWSNIAYDSLLKLEGYLGVEIYNHNCQRESLSGDAFDYLEFLWQNNKKVWAFAADDGHAKDIDKPRSEYFGGAIFVSAPELKAQTIVDNIVAGNFFSSSGPVIQHILKQGEQIEVQTSTPVSYIVLRSYPYAGDSAYSREGEPITTATFKIPSSCQYFYIVVGDEKGQKAWSNPFFTANFL